MQPSTPYLPISLTYSPLQLTSLDLRHMAYNIYIKSASGRSFPLLTTTLSHIPSRTSCLIQPLFLVPGPPSPYSSPPCLCHNSYAATCPSLSHDLNGNRLHQRRFSLFFITLIPYPRLTFHLFSLPLMHPCDLPILLHHKTDPSPSLSFTILLHTSSLFHLLVPSTALMAKFMV